VFAAVGFAWHPLFYVAGAIFTGWLVLYGIVMVASLGGSVFAAFSTCPA
jgi:hypothetical protein